MKLRHALLLHARLVRRSTMKSVGLSGSPSTWAWTRMMLEAFAEVTNHFSPLMTVLALPLHRAGLDHSRIGAGIGLGDRVAGATVAGVDRQQVVAALLRPCRTSAAARPSRPASRGRWSPCRAPHAAGSAGSGCSPCPPSFLLWLNPLSLYSSTPLRIFASDLADSVLVRRRIRFRSGKRILLRELPGPRLNCPGLLSKVEDPSLSACRRLLACSIVICCLRRSPDDQRVERNAALRRGTAPD